MPSCLICKYRKASDDGVTYHKFPKNEQSRKLWISAIGIDNLKVTDFMRICSRHFPEDSFYYPLGGLKQRRYLKPEIFPTIFNNYEDHISASEKRAANTECFNSSVPCASKNAHTSKKYLDPATSHTTENISSSCITECDMQVESQLQLTPNTSEDCAYERSKQTSTTSVPVEVMGTSKKLSDPSTKWKRVANPLFFGDCDIRDLKCPERAARNWKIASDTIMMQRKKIRILQMRNIRLKRKVNDMQLLITQLKQKQPITGEAGEIISPIVSVPNNADFSDVEEISDSSSLSQIEGNLSEPVNTTAEIKEEDKINGSAAMDEVDEIKIHEKMENDYVFHEHVRNEENPEYCTQNITESVQNPLAISDINLEVNKKEFEFVEIKEELITEVQEVFKCEDSMYSVDMEECKEDIIINVDPRETIIADSSIIEHSEGSVKDMEIPKTFEDYDLINSSTSFEQGIKMPHKRVTSNKCYECHKIFSSAVHLKSHFNSTHEGKKDYECYECTKRFSRYSCLRIHINSVHKGIKNYMCNECFKMFSKPSHLKFHINSVHKGIKNYQCKNCLKMFSQAVNLKVHINSVHKGIKNYKCNECKKVFSKHINLKRHIEGVHKGIKSKCNECNKMFSQTWMLKRHIDSVHKGIKNYKCNECQKAFSIYTYLKRHINSVHKAIKSKCNECNKMFSLSWNLKQHIDRMHNKDEQKPTTCKIITGYQNHDPNI